MNDAIASIDQLRAKEQELARLLAFLHQTQNGDRVGVRESALGLRREILSVKPSDFWPLGHEEASAIRNRVQEISL